MLKYRRGTMKYFMRFVQGAPKQKQAIHFVNCWCGDADKDLEYLLSTSEESMEDFIGIAYYDGDPTWWWVHSRDSIDEDMIEVFYKNLGEL